MLKHCSPSSVDIQRRSRKSLQFKDQEEEDNESHSDAFSSRSGSTVSDHAGRLGRLGQHDLQGPLDASATSFRDASTSPLLSTQQLRQHQLRQHRRVPLAVVARQKSLSGGVGGSSVCPADLLQPFRVAIKVYAKCLRADIEYKTLSVDAATTSRDVIWQLLSKYRMKHRDPKLFYLTMDISIKRTGIPLKRSLSLDDDSRPLELKSCHPWGDCKFTLQMRKGGVVRVYDSVLMAESKYKCLLVSEATTAEDVVRMLFHCYGLDRVDRVDRYRLHEVNPGRLGQPNAERRLAMDDRPMLVQAAWPAGQQAADGCRFVLRAVEENQETKVDLDASYASGDSASDCSAGFSRDSPVSASTRSTISTDSGLLKSSPETRPSFLKHRHTSNRPQHQQQQQIHLLQRDHSISRQISLHSLLEALPAASVDTGLLDSKARGASLSSISLESRSSDYDSYFYI